jgi:tripartite-type tricarboxylate transporter receptor subunit TctC
VAFASLGQVKPLMDAGKVKVLAVAASRRSALLPQVPTMDEAGVPGFELSSWYALLVPSKTPSDIVDRLVLATKTAITNPTFVKQMESQGLEIIGSTSAEMLDVMHADTRKWKQIIDITGTQGAQ